MSNVFLVVHTARNSNMASTASSDIVRKIELSPCCQNQVAHEASARGKPEAYEKEPLKDESYLKFHD